MTIRLKTTLVVLIAALASAVLLLSGTFFLFMHWADQRDTAAAREGMRRVLTAVDGEVDELASLARDYASWDDTYAFVRGGDRAYIAANFMDVSLQNNRIDLLIITGPDGEPLHAAAYDSARGGLLPAPPDVVNVLRKAGALPRDPTTFTGASGLVSLSAGVFLVSAQPILTSGGQGPARGVFVFGRAVDPAEVALLAAAARLSFSAFPPADARLTADLRARLVELAQADPILVTSARDRSLTVYGVMRDMRGGAPALVFSLRQETVFRSQAVELFSIFTAMLGAFMVVGTLGGLRMIDAFILARLRRLEAFTRGVHSTEQLAQRISVKGTDEITALASSVNGMLDSLQRETRQRFVNEERLQALVELEQMEGAPFVTLCSFALEAAVRMTGSSMGLLALVSPDEQTLTVQSWSRAAMTECALREKPLSYALPSTGLWGEAVRQRRVVVTNDYASAATPKKGYPAGHVPIRGHMGVPIFESARIVMVACVANKGAAYDDTDARQVTLLMGGMWRLVQRREALDALKKSEERFQDAARVTGQIIYEYSIAARNIQWAGAITPITGRGPEEFQRIGLSEYRALIHPDDLHGIVDVFQKALDDCGPFRVTYRLSRSDGSWVWVEDAGVFLAGGGGKAARMLGAVKDVSERVLAQEEKLRYEERIRQAAKMEAVGRLAGGVAHEFNNALTGILGYTELLMRTVGPGGETYAELAEIHRAGEHASTLTAQLLAFSRKQVISPLNVDLNAILRDSTSMLARLMQEDVELATRCAASAVVVYADPHQVGQILLNLALNARDAMPRGGRFVLEAGRARVDAAYAAQHPEARVGEWALLSVSDTGTGMSRDTVAHLFEPFFTTKDLSQGAGLGLAMIYGAIRQNNGFINVYSEPGIGTTFKMYLPLVEAAAEPEKPLELAAIQRGTETILLVEDEAMVRTLATRILSRQGYTVITGGDAAEALSQAAAHPGRIDLLLTDMVMPGGNGKELYEKLRVSRPEMRVLFMSGYAESIITRHGVLEEGVRFLSKPFTMNALAGTVRDILDGK